MGENRSHIKFVLEDERFCAGFTSKFGGVSKGTYESLNLGDHVGDDLQDVVANREILAHLLDINEQSLKFMHQIHSNNVQIIRTIDDQIPPCDAIITNLKNIALCVLVADCSPIIVIDEICEVIAVIHAGRKGVIDKICTNTVNLMERELGSRQTNLKIFVGPNIKSSCYEVGNMDLGEFNKYKNGNKFDMNRALKDEFEDLGVKDVKFDETCTHCDKRYFSYRRDGITGRFSGFVMMRQS